jgi:hypothetical protein
VNPEPKRYDTLESLWPPFAERIRQLLAALEAKGFRPLVFETKRSPERQAWLYGFGRTHHRGQRPVTWKLHSRHEVGKATDIIDKDGLWDSPPFFLALAKEAKKLGLKDASGHDDFSIEQCHVQW